MATTKKVPATKAAATPEKKAAGSAFMKPMKISADLAKVIGAEPLPRTEVTKRIWEYIKANKLQNPENKRMIKADAKLKVIFKKDEVSMFEMTKLVSAHLS